MDDILRALDTGKISVMEARKMLTLYSIQQVEDFAKIDLDRARRRGIPEVILAETKQDAEIRKIVKQVMTKSDQIIISRIRKEDRKKLEGFVKSLGYTIGRGRNCSSISVYKKTPKPSGGSVGILTAGTSDVGLGEEARLVAESMGCVCHTSYDVGVAGMHRVMPALKEFVKNDVGAIVVVAGMEGALATVVSSLVDIPVIGVPSSVGYGYGGGGVAALASMLQSCSLGLSVVNIDNGIAAGAIAANIANRMARSAKTHDPQRPPAGRTVIQKSNSG